MTKNWKFKLQQLDEAQLIQFALTSPISISRFYAIEMINDQQALCKIAMNDSNADNKKLAIRKLQSDTLLFKIAKESPDWWLRKLATQKIYNPSLVTKILENEKNKYVHLEGLPKIKSQQQLIDLFLMEPHHECRSLILEKLTLESLLTLRLLAKEEHQPLIAKTIKKLNRSQSFTCLDSP